MRNTLLAALLAFAPMAAQAAVTPAEEALVRCQVDFDIAFELLVPIREDQTEEDALATVDPELLGVATGLRALSREASRRIVGWTHHSGADSSRLGEVERAEQEELIALLAAAKTEQEDAAAGDIVLDRVDACGEMFPDLLDGV